MAPIELLCPPGLCGAFPALRVCAAADYKLVESNLLRLPHRRRCHRDSVPIREMFPVLRF